MKKYSPFKYSNTNKRYHTYDYFVKQKFGCKCFKIPLDCGFTCPNIDGSKGTGGCTYCGGRYNSDVLGLTIAEQYELHRKILHKKWQKAKYIPYFQSFTNTYAPVEKLTKLYESALELPDVVGLSIATRPDTLPDDVVEYLREIDSRTFLTVELGLQTIHDETANRVNRGHSFYEFLEGYNKLSGLNICIHIINGLPGEFPPSQHCQHQEEDSVIERAEMMLETAREVALLRPHSVKIHSLYVIRGTKLAQEYLRGSYTPLTIDEYVEIVAAQLELLPPETVVARVTGDGMEDELLAPLWGLRKIAVMNNIDKLLVRQNSWQGKRWEGQMC